MFLLEANKILKIFETIPHSSTFLLYELGVKKGFLISLFTVPVPVPYEHEYLT